MTYGDVVIEEKEDPEDEPERKRKRDPLSVQIPEAHKPRSPISRLKRFAHRERQRLCTVKTTPIRHGRRGDEGERHAIVSTETAYVPMEKRRARKKFE